MSRRGLNWLQEGFGWLSRGLNWICGGPSWVTFSAWSQDLSNRGAVLGRWRVRIVNWINERTGNPPGHRARAWEDHRRFSDQLTRGNQPPQ